MMGKPKIRFKGYNEDWEQRKLGKVADIGTGKLDANAMNETGEYDFYTSGIQKYKIDVPAFEGPAITIAGNGATVGYMHLANGKFNAYQRTYVLSAFQANREFLFYEIGNKLPKKISQEARTGNIPYIVMDMLTDLQLSIPCEQEQRKLGEFMMSLDHLITLHHRECVILRKTKVNDWEQRKLGELAEIVGGGTPSTSVDSYWDGDIDWYAPAEIGEQIYLESSQRKITEEGLTKSSAKILPIGTVLFTSRAGIGKTAILLKEGCTNQGFQSIVPNKEKLDSYFIFTRSEELKRYGETVGAGSTFVEVSGKQMANMELMMPKTMSEQQKIGEYFANLDHLITLHHRK